MRADGRVERLPATATVVGLFAELECAVAEVMVEPGDVLLIFSDGASEAWSDSGEEYIPARVVARCSRTTRCRNELTAQARRAMLAPLYGRCLYSKAPSHGP
jgi:serine phosphatase RsbU (regulator of sigma subunit)